MSESNDGSPIGSVVEELMDPEEDYEDIIEDLQVNDDEQEDEIEVTPSNQGSGPLGDDDADEEEEGELVRQNSSFARLSAESWVTVVSEYEDEDGPNENLLFSQVEEEPKASGVEANGEDSAASRAVEGLDGRSVLDCVVELLRGTRVTKKKLFNRQGERWIWLGYDLLSLNWKSKKKQGQGRLNLAMVKKLKGVDNRILIENTKGKRMQISLNTPKETLMWTTGLSCLVPKKAKVSHDVSPLKERINFDPLKDAWRGKLISTRKRVNEYVLLGGIGRGSFGKVKLALSTDDKRFYAVKIMNKGKSQSSGVDMGSLEESAILRKLKHPNLMLHRDFLHDEESHIIVVEYMARGVVMDSSKLEGVKPLSEDGVREIMKDVVLGLEYMHFQRIVHRDIKPDNLLRAGDGTVKLGDFGEAKFYCAKSAEARTKLAAPGTPAFIAPELCMSGKTPPAPPESYAADVWSLGATIFYMVYGRAPFLAKNVFEIYEAICTQRLEFPESPRISRKLKDLLKGMMQKDPKSRSTLTEVAKHPWFGEKLVQTTPLEKISVTESDINNAIKKATWKIPLK